MLQFIKGRKVSFTGSRMVTILACLISGTAFGQNNEVTLASYSGQPEIVALRSVNLIDGFHVATGGSVRIYIQSSPTIPSLPAVNRNYFLSRTFKKPGVTESGINGVFSIAEENRTVQYVDAIGRPVQSIEVMGSPAFRDLVQHIEYDVAGRESVKYAAYVERTGTTGSFRTYAKDSLVKFYDPLQGWESHVNKTAYPYVKTVFENSPLGRAIEQGAQGHSWQPYDRNDPLTGKSIKTVYATNSDGEVAYWRLYGTSGITQQGNYAKGKLHKTIVYDENNPLKERAGSVEEFKDFQGRTVLRRQWKTSTESLSTYYVYDSSGNLIYVVPPGVTGTLISEDGTNELHDVTFRENVYAYRYDNLNRLIKKKLPGRGWEWLVYNASDKLVMTQDAVQRTAGKWSYVKYDDLGREVSKGIYTNSLLSTQEQAQSAVNAVTLRVEYRQDSIYSNQAFPTSSMQPLLVNYYDNYTFEGKYRLPSAGVSASAKTKTLQTGLKVYRDDGTAPLLTVSYYDDEGRLIQSVSQNHIGGKETVTNTYSFAGELLTSTRIHRDQSGAQTAIVTKNEYDHVGRLLAVKHKIGSQDTVLLIKNEYNEIGQLKNRSVGGSQTGDNFHTALAYGYNERGWGNSVSSPYFSYTLKYDQPSQGAVAQYNGNIAEQHWTQYGESAKYFTYTYDKLNRLSDGYSVGAGMREVMQYDDRGNITGLTRDGSAFAYTYMEGNRSNRLLSVTGGVNSYTYDANGNATLDRKGMNIRYNQLNLPDSVWHGTVRVGYLYDATGVKLRKYSNQGGNRDYVGGIEYAGSNIELIHTGEGVAYRNSNGTYTYRYNLTDHLGNVRATIYRNPTTGAIEVLQKDNFYPFGKQQVVAAGGNKYLYNGKEIQNDVGNQYDYGARFYDAEIGRWNVIDPLAEQYRRFSPYNYAVNNPIRFIDPDGMAVTDYTDGGFAASGEDAQRIFAQFKKVNGLNGSSDEDEEDDQEDPPKKKKKKGYWRAFSEASAAADPFYQVGQTWTRWIGEGPGALFEDVGNTFGGFTYNLGSLFFAETWVDMYNSGNAYINASPEERGAADGAAAAGVIEGAFTYAPLGIYSSAASNLVRGVSGFEIAVYRVYGDGASMYGKSYSLINPLYVPNYRNFAGLPNVNSGEFLLKGYIPLKDIKIGRLFAAPLDGKIGGLPLELYQNYKQLRRPSNVILNRKF
ncbi:DUF6443 domain-containing protein [Sphingobacterium sp. LRF_L2]|uniref:DUF6443 domain-containing protein n=1 Tax=Sphingobacterium sp. LRF_L2 TaxID=3369421 RepID=UPI003F5F2D9F